MEVSQLWNPPGLTIMDWPSPGGRRGDRFGGLRWSAQAEERWGPERAGWSWNPWGLWMALGLEKYGILCPGIPGRHFLPKESGWGKDFCDQFQKLPCVMFGNTNRGSHPQAATTKCISALPAKRRLLISGTPIQNSALVCHLFSWCPLEPVDAFGWWIVQLAAAGRKGRSGITSTWYAPWLSHVLLCGFTIYFILWSMMSFWYTYMMILVTVTSPYDNFQTFKELWAKQLTSSGERLG